MIKKIVKALVAAGIITVMHFIIINFFDWRYNFYNFDNTVWSMGLHSFLWVKFAYGAGLMFAAYLIFEIIRIGLAVYAGINFNTFFKYSLAAVITGLLHFTSVYVIYYEFNLHQTMFKYFDNFEAIRGRGLSFLEAPYYTLPMTQAYAWAPYVEGTIVMIIAAFIFEMIRGFLRKD